MRADQIVVECAQFVSTLISIKRYDMIADTFNFRADQLGVHGQ